MNRNRSRMLALVSLFLLISMPCSVVQVQLTEPPPTVHVSSSVPPVKIQSTFTNTVPAPVLEQSPVPNVPSTATFMPASTFTQTFTFTVTNTPLPPLPDFDDVISYGGGGGGPLCTYPRVPNQINISPLVLGSTGWRLCLMLSGINFNQPFQLMLSHPGGPTILKSRNLSFDLNNNSVLWEGFPGKPGVIETKTSDGTVALEILIWWPDIFSEGVWRITVMQGQFRAHGDYQVAQSIPIISSLDRRANQEIMPAFSGTHQSGYLDVTGWNYSPNMPVYVLLYRDISTPSDELMDFKLTRKQIVISDAHGALSVRLIGPFEPGRYLLFGIINPNVHLGDSTLGFCLEGPCEVFGIKSSSSANSCPGAPPQRMAVNQRGYVCTQSDRVRLRNSPAKSADTIVYVNTGTQFTVIGGPSCSDSWSWWNIRLDDGTTGWLSEGGDAVDPYFICPLP